MKSVKVTKASKPWYSDACGTALALEFVGERWSLLVMRELMFGARRFGELRANLPGISANVLTQRLEGLEANGLLTRRKLASPAGVHVYELTDWGLEVEPIFQTMGRWATRSRRHDPTMFLSPASAMLSLRTMIAPDGPYPAIRIAFRFPADAFVATLGANTLTIVRGESADVDLVFACDPTTLVRIIYGKWPIAEAEAAGVLEFAGDRALAGDFIALFDLPEKIAD